MPTQPNSNGTSLRLLFLLLSMLALTLVGVVGGWAQSTTNRVADLERRQAATEARQERIESKLDFLVDAERRRNR